MFTGTNAFAGGKDGSVRGDGLRGWTACSSFGAYIIGEQYDEDALRRVRGNCVDKDAQGSMREGGGERFLLAVEPCR